MGSNVKFTVGDWGAIVGIREENPSLFDIRLTYESSHGQGAHATRILRLDPTPVCLLYSISSSVELRDESGHGESKVRAG